MKNKNTAAIIAFTSGFVGTHRFYLGQTLLGFLYIAGTCGAFFFNFKIMLLIAILEGIRFLTMSPEEFNNKYNRGKYSKKDIKRAEREARQAQRRSGWEEMERSWNVTSDNSGFKKEGIEKYKAYSFEAAIAAFEKALAIQKNDAPTYFNLACCYAMTEQKELAFNSLTTAVSLGMKDFQKILSHDGLAYLRIQPEWDNFVASGYTAITFEDEISTKNQPQETKEEKPVVSENFENPLDALRKLYEQRQQGLIDEAQFEKQSRDILR
jgi:TM2 domain-containing membrane protein YozV